MIDEKGHTMQGFVKKQDVDIYLSHCFLKEKLSQRPFCIKLVHNAFIKKIDLNEPLILFDQFSFIEFKEIDALCGNDIFLIIQ
uniref:Uncharacterized protein n=1 Tax=Manihot esculenta TaxID=3983 RepID=A0A2C9V5R7_MANES